MTGINLNLFRIILVNFYALYNLYKLKQPRNAYTIEHLELQHSIYSYNNYNMTEFLMERYNLR